MSRTTLPVPGLLRPDCGSARPVLRSTPLVELISAERLGREHFAGRAVEHVEVAVAVGMDEHLARLRRATSGRAGCSR